MSRPARDPLRPERLADFGGQPDIATEVDVLLRAAGVRGELPPHMLFAGPPGLGKTTLAAIMAAELTLPLVTTSGPLLEKPSDLAGILVGISEPTVVFIDEIHRIPIAAQEILYTAMEDGRLDVVVPEGAGRSRTLSIPLEPFVLIGATTKAGLLSGPLRGRFGYVGRLSLYTEHALSAIVARSAGALELDVTPAAAALVASRSRGTPRTANKWLRRVRDYADASGATHIDEDLAVAALDLFGVDALGLDKVDRRLLSTLVTTFSGGPVGVATLATAIEEETRTLEEVHEPYLMRAGLLARTARGRVATAAAYTHLGLAVPAHLAGDAAS